jgi:RND family efflux transporter MFP subunit
MKKYLRWRSLPILVGVGIAGLLVFNYQYSFGKKADLGSREKQPPLVTVTTSQEMDLPIEYSAQGHVISLHQVDIRSQITGIIRSVDFREGSAVRAGQLLFTLDATDANAQLRRTQAVAAQIQAQLDDARRDLVRSKELLKEAFVSPSAVDTAGSKVDALQAQLKAAHADIDSARVMLDHTRIFSPASAQSGALNVHAGSLAQPNAAAPLVTLMQLDPVGVEFTLPEQDLKQLLAARAAAPVAVKLDSSTGPVVEGTLSFINNTVNPDTGTISIKASMPNRAGTLWPGTFARVTVSAGVTKGAVVLPPQAVLEGPSGRFVYQVGADDKVVAHAVSLLRIQNGLAVVVGLNSGEKIVLEGNQNLRAGSLVRYVQSKEAVRQGAATP